MPAPTQVPTGNGTIAVPVSRVFLLDKPAGISSFAALGALKRGIGTKKVGHAGTLDPFATGLLIAASGKMTKTAGMLTDMDKEYEAVFRFGAETDTLDTEGAVVAEAPVPGISEIETGRTAFLGTVTQTPPAYSAVKIDGRRAYDRARSGQTVDMPERQVVIHEFTILSWEQPDLRVRIRCSKGTYIRSIARDLAIHCGSRGYCRELRRTGIGPFSVDDAVAADKVTAERGLAPADFFKAIDVPVITVEKVAADQLRQGVPLHRIKEFDLSGERMMLCCDPSEKPAALLEFSQDRIGYRIVFD